MISIKIDNGNIRFNPEQLHEKEIGEAQDKLKQCLEMIDKEIAKRRS